MGSLIHPPRLRVRPPLVCGESGMKISALTYCIIVIMLTGFTETVAFAKPPRDKVQQVASCIAKKDSVQTHALVLSVPGSADEASHLTAMANTFGSCGAASFTQTDQRNLPLLIGALAEPISTSFGEITGHWQGVPDRDKLAMNSAKRTRTYPVNAAVARCLFDVYPDEGEDYVRAARGSKRGSRALALLQSEISRCIDAGEEIAMTMPQFRAEMVRAYVRYVCAPNDPTPLTFVPDRERADA